MTALGRRLSKLEAVTYRAEQPPYSIPLLGPNDPDPDPSTIPPGWTGPHAIRLVGVSPQGVRS